jgi:hypothetical protein
MLAVRGPHKFLSRVHVNQMFNTPQTGKPKPIARRIHENK